MPEDRDPLLVNSIPNEACEPVGWRERVLTPPIVLLTFTLINTFTYYDRGCIAGALEDIRTDSNINGGHVLSDAKGGALVSAFMVGFMISCPIFAGLGGRFSAKNIICFGLSVWCLACFLSGLAQGFWMLICCRCFVGIGEAAYVGYTVTIIDNIAPKHKRTMWIGIFYSMIPCGTALGMAAGSIIGGTDGFWILKGWRVAFLSEVIPMIFLIFLTAALPDKYNPTQVKPTDPITLPPDESSPTTPAMSAAEESIPSIQKLPVDNGELPQSVEEPGGLAGEGRERAVSVIHKHRDIPGHKAGTHISVLAAIKLLLVNPVYVLLCLGFAIYTFVLGAIAIFAIPALVEGPLKLSAVAASSIVGGATAITGLAGSVIGGLFVDKVGGSQGEGGIMKCSLFNTASMILAVPCGIIALLTSSLPVFIIFFILAVLFSFVVTAPTNASILSCVHPDLRTYGISFSILIMHALGDFPSPVITGMISDSFSEGCEEHKHEDVCSADPKCRWIKLHDGKTFCTNPHQTPRALAIVFAVMILAAVFWGSVYVKLWMDKRKLRKQRRNSTHGQ